MPGLKVGFSSNIQDVLANLDSRRSQIPYAIAVALTKTAQSILKAEQGEMRRALDRPTPFTLNSLRVLPATKRSLSAEVLLKDYIKDPQFKHYLEPQVHGGGRPQKAFERRLAQRGLLPSGWFALPGKGAKLNAYGNMSTGQITQILAVLQALPTAGAGQGFQGAQTARSKKRNKRIGDYFASTPSAPAKSPNGGRLPFGVWQRKGKRIVNVLFFVPRVSYRPRLQFFEIAKSVSTQQLQDNFRSALAQATANAR